MPYFNKLRPRIIFTPFPSIYSVIRENAGHRFAPRVTIVSNGISWGFTGQGEASDWTHIAIDKSERLLK